MINIAIVDDIPGETLPLKEYLNEYASVNRLELTLDSFERAEELLKDYRPFRYTVIFMDIYMDGMTGVEAAKRIRQTDSDTFLVFFTNSLEYMPEAFSLHAFEYMEKPVKRDRIFAVLDDILKLETDRSSSPLLEVLCSRKELNLPFDDIIFVRSDGNYQEIGCKNGKTHRTRIRFSDISAILTKDPRFLRIIRGILVNMDYIVRFRDNVCCLQGDINMPIKLKDSEALERIWRNYIFQKIRREHRGTDL